MNENFQILISQFSILNFQYSIASRIGAAWIEKLRIEN